MKENRAAHLYKVSNLVYKCVCEFMEADGGRIYEDEDRAQDFSASKFAMYGLAVRRTSYNSFPGVDIYEHAIPGAELEYVNPGSHQNRIGSSQLGHDFVS
ncbi:hypothetical protein F2Q69_00032875 [Brassica cretica]|uniref:Uncharacterized protein n=1 Tax=Brassica cretica TaxID=69181 RepID=A0A8S9SJF8_BRACR|nr:hypothetical protein F2Q69_00032875 [Brassica cretica]